MKTDNDSRIFLLSLNHNQQLIKFPMFLLSEEKQVQLFVNNRVSSYNQLQDVYRICVIVKYPPSTIGHLLGYV